MERAARCARIQVANIGLLAALMGGCATIQEPPGGPPDFDAPFILSVTPDSGSVVEDFGDAVEVQFNEVIDERSGSGLESLVRLSPRPEELRVSWKRTRIAVEPRGGWRDSLVYQLTLLPGFADLRNNRLDSGRTVVFSTGGEIPETRIDGTVIDWESGSAARRALVEAVRMPDSLVFFVTADSVGDFEIKHLRPGPYLLFATVDENSNGRREYRESFDSATVQLDSSASHVLWAFAHDTVGPRISEVSETDSITIKVDFDQKLAPGEPHDTAVTVFSLPDTTLLETVSVWSETTYDSVRAEEAIQDSIRQAAIADSILAAEEAAADSAAAEVGDTAAVLEAEPPPAADTAEVPEAGAGAADTVAAEGQEAAVGADSILGELFQVADSTARAPEDSAAADTSRATMLLSQRPELSETWYVRMASSLVPGERYLINAVAENVSGALAESQGLLILPERADTAETSNDSTRVRPDTT